MVQSEGEGGLRRQNRMKGRISTSASKRFLDNVGSKLYFSDKFIGIFLLRFQDGPLVVFMPQTAAGPTAR
jgi:hypothetical protein